MPSFVPSTVLVDLDDLPIRTGAISDPDKRAEIARARSAILKAKSEDQPEMEHALQLKATELQDKLTLSSIVVAALTNGMQGDDAKAGSQKLDMYEWAIKVKKAETTVDFTNTEMDVIKERVSKMYPSALIVGQFLKAIKTD